MKDVSQVGGEHLVSQDMHVGILTRRGVCMGVMTVGFGREREREDRLLYAWRDEVVPWMPKSEGDRCKGGGQGGHG